MTIGAGLARLDGYPFEVRYSQGSLERAQVAADVARDAYDYLRSLFSGVEPDIALIVAAPQDWESRQPFGLPFFNDGADQIRPGIVVMPAASGDFWIEIGQDLREAAPGSFERLLSTYPDGAGGLDLQPFFDLVTIHELGHAFEVFGDLRLPTCWLSEIFANLCLHAFVAARRPGSLQTLETLACVGVQDGRLDARMRAEGYSTLEELEINYTGGERPMRPLNYIWYQYRWQRIAAQMFNNEGADGLVRFWMYFRGADHSSLGEVTAAALAPLLRTHVSATLGRAVHEWR